MARSETERETGHSASGRRRRPKREKRGRRILASIALLVLAIVVFVGLGGDDDPPPPGAIERHYRAADRRMHVVESGDPTNPPLLLVHGSPGGWDAFRRYLIDPSILRRSHVLAIDRLGFGKSDGRPEPSLARQAAAAAGALEANHSGCGAVVVGHSLGGAVAGKLAMDSPEKVAALVLLSPSIDPALEEHRWFHRLARRVSWIVPRELDVSNREIWPLRGELEAIAEDWGAIDVPTIVVQGMRDRLVPPENAAFAERLLAPDVLDVRRLPEAGHFIPWKNYDDVRTAILDALERIPCTPVPEAGTTSASAAPRRLDSEGTTAP